MGIPKLLPFLVDRYPNLIQKCRANELPTFDNLYLDMNGIVHACWNGHVGDKESKSMDASSDDVIFGRVETMIETLYRLVGPQKRLYLAFDGVAPHAKWNKQRQRRFRVARERQTQSKPTEGHPFDSNCISPGSKFSAELQAAMKAFITRKLSSDKLWRNCQITLNGTDTPGEGTQKIFDYIRCMQGSDNYDPTAKHCVFSMDSDVIMLAIASQEVNLTILRNEVKIHCDAFRGDATHRFHLLHIELLREYIELEFDSVRHQIGFSLDMARIADDWVLLCFLIGNDFLPHLPKFDVMSGGLLWLYKAYAKVLPKLDGYLHEAGILNQERFGRFLATLCAVELVSFIQAHPTCLEKATTGDTDDNRVVESTSDMIESLRLTDLVENQAFVDDKNVYYASKLHLQSPTEANVDRITQAYMKTIEWNLAYYFRGIPSWDWYYPYNYAPFVSDLLRVPAYCMDFDLGEPVSPITHLLAILPATSGDHLLPAALHGIAENELKAYYPSEYHVDHDEQPNWAAIAQLPFVCKKTLVDAVSKRQPLFTLADNQRDTFGSIAQYEYCMIDNDAIVNDRLLDPMAFSGCSSKKPCNGIRAESEFSTTKLLAHMYEVVEHDETRQQEFNSASLVLKPKRATNTDMMQLAEVYIGQEICYAWPHRRFGKVMAISATSTYIRLTSDGICDESKASTNLAAEFVSNVQHLNTRYKKQGIQLDRIDQIVQIAPYKCTEFILDDDHCYHKKQCWSDEYEMAALQTTFLRSRSPILEQLDCVDVLKAQSTVFLCGNKTYYGRKATGIDTTRLPENGRVGIYVPLHAEPNLTEAKAIHAEEANRTTAAAFKNVQYASSSIGLRPNIFLSITGDVLVIVGDRNDPNPKEGPKINVGLRIKSHKLELRDYTMNVNGAWLYTKRAAKLVNDYREKFPQLFEILNNNLGQYPLFSSDFKGAGGQEYLQEASNWLRMQVYYSLPKQSVGTTSLGPRAVAAIGESVDKLLAIAVRTIRLQVNPNIIYVPNLNGIHIMPDPKTDFILFDRVVCVRYGYPIAVGAKGTVISIRPKHDPHILIQNDYLYSMDIRMDEPFQTNGKTETVFTAFSATMFINISFGSRQN